MTTYFDALGLDRNATAAEVKSAFRKLARELHPDLNPANAKKFALVTAAYNALTSEDGLVNARYGFGKGYEGWRREWEEMNGLVGTVKNPFKSRNATADDIADLIREQERLRREARRMREEAARRKAEETRFTCATCGHTNGFHDEAAHAKAEAPKRERTYSEPSGRCGKHTKSGDCIRPEGHPHSCMSQKVADTKKANAAKKRAAAAGQ